MASTPRCYPALLSLLRRHDGVTGFGSPPAFLTCYARWVGSPRFTEEAAVRTSTPRAQSFTQDAEGAHTGRGQHATINTASLPGLEACPGRFGNQPSPRVELPPWASGSLLAKAETHAKSAPAQRGVCHQLPQVNSPGRQRAGPPSSAGRLLPIVPGQAGLLPSWKPGKHSQTQPGFH